MMKRAFGNALAPVRKRLQMERLARGVARLLLFALLGSLAFTYLLSQSNFSDTTIFWARIVLGSGIILLIVHGILLPLFRPPTERQLARFLEERYPQLEDRMSTAVGVHSAESETHPTIRRLIRDDALGHFKTLQLPRFYWPRASAFSLAIVAISAVTLLTLFLGGPGVFRYSMDKVFLGWLDRDQAPLYQIQVEPGDTVVGERADQEVRASLVGFSSQDVNLFAKYERQTQWEQVKMLPGEASGQFSFLFLDIRDRIDYYVDSEGIRSDVFTIMVSEIPRVEELNVTLRFPSYTGMPEAELEDGNISALVGTTAVVRVRTDQPVSEGSIRFENADNLTLTSISSQELEAEFKIASDDYYRIFLKNSEGVSNPGTDEFSIIALDDQPPVISFSEPGRDRKVTNIEEVFTEVKASDDHGISRLTLTYSINGRESKTIPLNFARGSSPVTSAHTFYLEEYNLEPGDFVSYYAAASDAVSKSATDLYFFEVTPYDREYYQAQSMQGGGGAMGGESPLDLSRQQKQVVVASFSLVQERDRYTSGEFRENSQTLALVQQRIRSQASTIMERIKRRGQATSGPRFQKMVEYFEEAVQAMEPAEKALNQIDPEKALPDEQRALQQLLRVESLFKEMQVAMSQSGGQGSATPQELADLVDLELDETKNQYETLQQNRQSSREQAVDEALEKLKELAQRQEQQIERQRQRMAQNSSGGSSLSQEQLMEEVERLARELARLSRQEQDPQLNEISRELQRAAREMQQSRQSGQNSQASEARARQALDRLQKAQQALNQHRNSQMRNEIDGLKQASDELVREQEEVVESIQDLEEKLNSQEFDRELARQFRELLSQKSDLQNRVQELEGDLHQTARRLQSSEREASRKLKEAGIEIRDQRLNDKMREGSDFVARGLMSMARNREQDVQEDLQQLSERIRDAEQALGQGTQANPQERLQQALSNVGSLVEQLESLKDRAQQAQSGQQDQQQENQQGAPSQQQAQQGQQSQSQQQGQQQSQQSQGQASSSGTQSSGSQQEGTTSAPGEVAPPQGFQPSSSAGGVASSGIDPQQARHEWQQRVRQAEQIRETLQENGQLAGEAGRLLNEMRNLNVAQVLDDPEEVARLKSQIIDGFHQLELEINRQLEATRGAPLQLVNDEEVPPEFRDRVEEYYRRLSERR